MPYLSLVTYNDKWIKGWHVVECLECVLQPAYIKNKILNLDIWNLCCILAPKIMEDIRKLNKIVKKVLKNERFHFDDGQVAGEARLVSLSFDECHIWYEEGHIVYCDVNIEVDIKSNNFEGYKWQNQHWRSKRRNLSIKRSLGTSNSDLTSMLKFFGIKSIDINRITIKK